MALAALLISGCASSPSSPGREALYRFDIMNTSGTQVVGGNLIPAPSSANTDRFTRGAFISSAAGIDGTPSFVRYTMKNTGAKAGSIELTVSLDRCRSVSANIFQDAEDVPCKGRVDHERSTSIEVDLSAIPAEFQLPYGLKGVVSRQPGT